MYQANLCYYANLTSHIQILRIKEKDKISWERVVFPQERLFFSAGHSDDLEIYGKNANNLTKIDHICCQYLLVSDTSKVDHNFGIKSSFG